MAIQQQQIKPQSTKIRNKETRPKKQNTIENGRRIYKKERSGVLITFSRFRLEFSIRPAFSFLSFSFSTLRNNNSSQVFPYTREPAHTYGKLRTNSQFPIGFHHFRKVFILTVGHQDLFSAVRFPTTVCIYTMRRRITSALV